MFKTLIRKSFKFIFFWFIAFTGNLNKLLARHLEEQALSLKLCNFLQWLNTQPQLQSTDVADTFPSVHIKCCFHQKKIKSKRPTTRIRPAERQHKGRDQSSTNNVTSKTPRLHSVAKQHKVSDRSVWNPKTTCIQTKSNKIWFRKAKSKERRKEVNRAEEDLKRWCHGKKQKTFH